VSFNFIFYSNFKEKYYYRGKCKQTFRGHVDSVNHVGFIPYTNNLFTCSGDKTLSIWDARSGLCTQTLYGHLNAINHVAFTLRVRLFIFEVS
jgi:sperm-associated antigen 16 protein